MYIIGLLALLLLLVSAILLHFRVYNSITDGLSTKADSSLSGADFARELLKQSGMEQISVEVTESYFGDHYDPKDKAVRLSEDVYYGKSLSAYGIAAHEIGHAQQGIQRYYPLKLMSFLLPLLSIVSCLAWLSLLFGLYQAEPQIIAFSLTLVILLFLGELLYLPVEYNANKRAAQMLKNSGFFSENEQRGISSILTARAYTYLGGIIAAILAGVRRLSGDPAKSRQ